MHKENKNNQNEETLKKDLKETNEKDDEQIDEKEEVNEDEIDKVEITKEEIEAMNKKINDSKELYLRAQAELVNYRKRKDEEISRTLKYCNENLISEILPVIDNFERALSQESSDQKLLDGINMVYGSLKSILLNYGLQEMDCLDKPFDPNFHQAVTTESVSDKDDDIVLEVLQKGYMFKDKILRPAMVKVNKIERNDK